MRNLLRPVPIFTSWTTGLAADGSALSLDWTPATMAGRPAQAYLEAIRAAELERLNEVWATSEYKDAQFWHITLPHYARFRATGPAHVWSLDQPGFYQALDSNRPLLTHLVKRAETLPVPISGINVSPIMGIPVVHPIRPSLADLTGLLVPGGIPAVATFADLWAEAGIGGTATSLMMRQSGLPHPTLPGTYTLDFGPTSTQLANVRAIMNELHVYLYRCCLLSAAFQVTMFPGLDTCTEYRVTDGDPSTHMELPLSDIYAQTTALPWSPGLINGFDPGYDHQNAIGMWANIVNVHSNSDCFTPEYDHIIPPFIYPYTGKRWCYHSVMQKRFSTAYLYSPDYLDTYLDINRYVKIYGRFGYNTTYPPIISSMPAQNELILLAEGTVSPGSLTVPLVSAIPSSWYDLAVIDHPDLPRPGDLLPTDDSPTGIQSCGWYIQPVLATIDFAVPGGYVFQKP